MSNASSPRTGELGGGAGDPHTIDGACDLHATCIHEYAHLAVARHFGAFGFVTVTRVTLAEPRVPAWRGQFQLFGELPDQAWRIVALAGTLAEWHFDGATTDATALDAMLRWPGALSSCDEALARGFDRDDVQDCLAVLAGAWPTILRDAAERVQETMLRSERSR